MAKPKNVAHTRSKAELEAALAQQLAALRKLSADFDGGEMWAGRLLATVIFVLCHDGRQDTKSLLTQLGMRDSLQCLSTKVETTPGNLLHTNTLMCMKFGPGGPQQLPRFQAIGSDAFYWLPFADWWAESVHVSGASQEGVVKTVARWELIYFVRSQDGGSHYDATLSSESYVTLREGGGWQMGHGGQKLPLEPIHLLTLRAIAWELDESLKPLGH
jgi:hypothetical protein